MRKTRERETLRQGATTDLGRGLQVLLQQLTCPTRTPLKECLVCPLPMDQGTGCLLFLWLAPP